MKTFWISAALMLGCVAAACGGEKVVYKSQTGKQLGSSYSSGGKTTYRDPTGRNLGTVTTQGNRSVFKDQTGRQQWSSSGSFNPKTYAPKSMTKKK